ncbi:MAG: hypothetical protein AAF490_33170 [Chloroflexota bacterium]
MKNRNLLRLLFGSFLIILAACGTGGDAPASEATAEISSPAQEESQPSLLTEGDQNTAVNASPVDETTLSEAEEMVEETADEASEEAPDEVANGVEFDANGIQVGFTANGYPYRGNPDAFIVIEEFSDFQ